MKLREAWSLIGSRRAPSTGTGSRILDACHDIPTLRAAARRVLPRAVFDYIDGGADDEISLTANQEAFRRVRFLPRALQNVADPDLSTTLFGTRLTAPLVLAPTGYTRMVHPGGECDVARAAAAWGIPYTLSTVATTAIEQVAAQSPSPLWFQLYVLRDRGLTRALVERAQAAGVHVLEVAVDTAVSGHRTRDVRNGLTIPPRLTLQALLGIASRPRYWASTLRGAPLALANLQDIAQSATTVAGINSLFDPTVGWDDVAALRAHWPGALLLKGPLGPADVRRALELGADGVHLSNHGGRQLDRCVSPLDLLRPARDAVGHQLTIVVDSGIRHGSDIAAAVALGADACAVGRAYLYGAAVAGQRGVEHSIDLLTAQLRRAVQLLGVSSTSELRAHADSLVALEPGILPIEELAPHG